MDTNLIWTYGKALFSAIGLFILIIVIYHLLFRHIFRNEITNILDKRIRLPIYIFILIISLIIFLKFLPENFEKAPYEYYLNFFKLLSISVVLVELFSSLIFDYIWIKKQTEGVPTIFKDIIKFVVYTTLIMFILGSFNINIAPFLTTAGILTMVIGLALQDTLGNVFSGLAMQFSSPFKAGDIIEMGEIKGKIEKIDWRSTYIFTKTNDYIIVPHSTLSKLEIKNYLRPSGVTMKTINIGVGYDTPPTKVKKIITKILNDMNEISKEEVSRITIQRFDDFRIIYEVEFPIEMKSFDYCEYVQGEIFERIWYRFKKENIEIPLPTRNIYHKPEQNEKNFTQSLIPILKKVDFLNVLNDKKLEYLAVNTEIQYFTKDEIVCNYGDQGDSFYIIKSGEVSVYIPIEGKEMKVSTLRENDFFGEISLFTGEPRTATIKVAKNAEMLVLTKEDFTGLLKEEPEVANTISKVIAYRKSIDEMEHTRAVTARLTLPDDEAKKLQKETLSQQLLNKIKNFFAI